MARSMIALCGLIAFAATTMAQDSEHKGEWHADFDKAVAVAKEAKKDLLVDFTGSDWCGWCIRLHKEVFDHKEFLDGVNDKYVLVALDFPNDEAIKAKVPNPQRNEELQGKYGVQGFPTILLMNPEGEVYAKTGYQEGGPAKYLEHLKKIATEGKATLAEIAAMKAAYAAADGEKKIALVEKAIGLLEAKSDGDFGIDAFAAIAKDAFTVDPENARGLKHRAVKALMKVGQADEATLTMARAIDPKNESGLLEQVVFAGLRSVQDEESAKAALKDIADLDALGPLKDKELATMLYINAAVFCERATQDMEQAKKWAQKCKDLDPKNPGIKRKIDQLLKG